MPDLSNRGVEIVRDLGRGGSATIDAAMAVLGFLKPGTWTGPVYVEAAPSPAWPHSFEPHAQTDPSVRRASV